MHITFPETTRYATKHPASIAPGDLFADVDGDGNQTTILALRGAVRLRATAAYRIFGVNVATGKFAAHRFAEDRNVIVVGFVNDVVLDIGAAISTEGTDPAINERDAAIEALRDEPFTGEDIVGEHDHDLMTEPE